MCSLEYQLKIIAVLEVLVSAFFLGLNMKILAQLTLDLDENEQRQTGHNSRYRYNLSEAAIVMYFTIRVLYLFGEFILAIFLTYHVFRKNVNGLMLWFFMTIIFSIPSRCYFIGGILWDHYFVTTLAVFSANLAFTAYSLVIICFFVKQLTRGSGGGGSTANSSRRGSLATFNNEFHDSFTEPL